MPLLLQDVIVALVALAATVVLVRRVIGVVQPAGRPSDGCGACAGGAAPCTASRAADEAGASRPVTFVRPTPR